MPRSKYSYWPRPAAALAVSLGMALAGCKNADPAAMIAEARQHRDKGDLKAAVIELKNALQRDADHRAARLMLGELYLDLGDPQSAEKELRRALALGADGGYPILLLGKSLLMQGQYDRILAEIGRDAAPAQRPAILALRGNALLGQSKIGPAGEVFAEALKLQPDAPQALLGQARIATWQKQPDQARALLARALAANPADIDCLRYQADMLRAEGRGEQALAVQQKILDRRPHNAQALVDIANIHTDAGRFAQARASLAAARRVSGPSVGILYSDAMLDYRENKLAAALETVQKVLGSAPEHYPSVLLAGAIEQGLGAHLQAEQHLRKFLQAYPGHPYASKMLASVLLALQQPEPALTLLRPLLADDPADVDLLALAGEANLRARRYSAAASLFEQASGLRPDSPDLHTGAALSRLAGGDNARALAELERAASLEHGRGRTGVLLAMTYLRAGQPDKAMATVLEMEKQGDNPLLQNLKGGIRLSRNDVTGARAAFDRALALDPAYLPALANLQQLDAAERKSADTRKRYLAALEKSPGNTALMEALAGLAMVHGNRDEAVTWMERAMAEKPDALPLALRTGALYLHAGDKHKALRLAQKLHGVYPASPDVLAFLGHAQVAHLQYAQAAESYARLAALKPASGKPQMLLARTLAAQKQDGPALAALNKALALEPGLLEARITLVSMLLRQNRPAEAMAAALAEQKRAPDSASGYKLEGDVHAAQGRNASALAAYQRAFAISPNGPLQVLVYGMQQKLGRQSEADAALSQWLLKHPSDVPTRLYYASSKLVRNDVKGAIPHLEHVLKFEPDNLAALNDLAWSYQRSGERKGLAHAQRAYALAPGNPAIMDTLGWIYLEQGQTARALPLLQKASALAPNAAEIQYHLGMVLAKSGDKPGARRALEKALANPAGFARRDEAKALLGTL